MNYVLGIASDYHDSSAAIVRGSEIIAAAQEERFTRRKHESSFPTHAIQFCLSRAGIRDSDVATIAFYEKPLRKFERLIENYIADIPGSYSFFRKSIPIWAREKLYIKRRIERALPGYARRIAFVEHHLSHAATAFYCSGFSESTILTLDGVGEWSTTAIGIGKGNEIRTLQTLDFPSSLGLLYSAFTAYLGFAVNDGECKVMGLAAYGKPSRVEDILDELLDWRLDGSFRLNPRYFHFGRPDRMTTNEFQRWVGFPPRPSDSPILDYHLDLAASLQRAYESLFLRIATFAREIADLENIVIAGGCALNCLANSRLSESKIFKRMFVASCPGDGGGSLGAALYVSNRFLAADPEKSPSELQSHGRFRLHRLTSDDCLSVEDNQVPVLNEVFIGPDFDDEAIEAALNHFRLPFRKFLCQNRLCDWTAQQLKRQKIVGWFQGRMEFGPRALGARSILADPRDFRMRDRLNSKVKRRERFRPFAPSILEEYATAYFDLHSGVDYRRMSIAASRSQQITAVENASEQPHGETCEMGPIALKKRVRPNAELEAAIHIDGTARPQVVSREQVPLFHKLLSSFHKHTDCPAILNTSFNVKDEPIVCTPNDAVQCFLEAKLDVLVIGNYVVDTRYAQDEENAPCVLIPMRRQPRKNPLYAFRSAVQSDVMGSNRPLSEIKGIRFLRYIIFAIRGIRTVPSEIAILLVYVLVLIPIGMCKKIWGFGRLESHLDLSKKSYWRPSEKRDRVSDLFRQY
jgi:carbamoyltransferase